MGTLEESIRLNDEMSNVLFNIIGAVNSTVDAMDRMNSALASGADTSSFEEISTGIANVREQLAGLSGTELPMPQWESDTSIEVFSTTGIERWEQEIGSLNSMMTALRINQENITQNAVYGNVLPPNAANDMITLNERIGAIQARIQQINANPANAVDPAARNEAEQLRGQLNDMLQTQQAMNSAIENMDVSGANAAYQRLSQTVGNTERYIRDNVDEQGRFNHAIEQGASSANKFVGALKGAVSVYAVVNGVKKALEFASDCTEKFNTQLNAENQLMTVLGNTLDADYVSQFEMETTADTSGAVSDIQGLSNNIEGVEVPLSINKSVAANALQNEFDLIKAKASEIQGSGIYGDEAMIAGAAEFATYFSDTDAITTMMDTLSNYAMGMSGGGEIDTEAMVNYATGLGKIMSGSYDSMTKKGFEFTDAQKAVIEGTADEAQYVEVLGDGWRDMTEDMRAASAITQVIDEGWGGLYEKMSSTPEGKIIQLKNAWGDMQETIGQRLYPAIISIVDVVTENWDTVSAIADGVTAGLSLIIEGLGYIADGVLAAAQFFVDNWSWIEPIIMGICAGLAVYYGRILLVKAATTLAAVAQGLWNTAMNMNPSGAVAIAVGALAAALGLYTNSVNEAYGLSLSFAGMLGGSVMTVLAALGNIVIMIYNIVVEVIVGVWNTVAEFVNFFANVWTDPLGAVVRLFVGVFDGILQMVEIVADAVGNLFGQDWSSGIQGFRDKMNAAVEQQFGAGVEIVPKIDEKAWSLDYIDYGEAFDAGYYLGDNGFGDKTSGNNETDLSDIYNILNKGVGSGISDIADNTAQTADALDIADEDLKYLRDIAERDVVNRFTTAEISVNLGGVTNNVSNDADLDGMIDYLASNLQEVMESAAEGVHA